MKRLEIPITAKGFQPARSITIGEPCDASWETMPGGGASRFCDRCGKDVIDTAAMTPAAVNDLLARPDSAPCVRVMRYADGSIVTARAAQPATMTRRTMIAASAFVSLAVLTGCSKPQPLTGAVAPSEGMSPIGGDVVRADGSPAAGVKVELTRADSESGQTVPGTAPALASLSAMTDEKGSFHIMAPAGEWTVQALGGSQNADPAAGIELASEPVQASTSSSRGARVSLRLRSVQPLMGKIMPPKRPPAMRPKQPSGR